ncbi:acyl carrier protein [Candidatus Magnetaquicoccus inordinatus]|uniref:acyl carrier protein n=1 Tax=Candidatus Magnetaquicoccus inordinatus TaxID=2496818 RepID=UPI00102BBB4B|nr:phosphopantetheine-binding protein [Candidatus Magnetaquicoccus inordinatus]
MSELIHESVLDIFCKYATLRREEMTLETSLLAAGMDSLDAVEILFALEERFDITIPNPASVTEATVGDVVNLVSKLVAEKEASPSA